MPVTEPEANCQLCPRLAHFRDQNRQAHPGFFNAPVPVWTAPEPKMIIVGLAPGLKGANRTGRPFTGDYAGDLLFQTLSRAGCTVGTYGARPDDGFVLRDVAIINAVRCVPPQNKPVGAEIAACRAFLEPNLSNMGARVFLALGRIAHDSLLTTFGARRAAHSFGHGARHEIEGRGTVYDSFHCSRYNTNTGRLTEDMFESVVFAAIAEARTL